MLNLILYLHNNKQKFLQTSIKAPASISILTPIYFALLYFLSTTTLHSNVVIHFSSMWSLCYLTNALYLLFLFSVVIYLLPNVTTFSEANYLAKPSQFSSLDGLSLLKLCLTPITVFLIVHLSWSGPFVTAWFGHIAFSEYQFKTTGLLFFFFISYLFALFSFLHFSSTNSYDYVLSTFNFFTWLWISFSANNLFTFIFFLELLSASIMLIMITSSFSSFSFYNNTSYYSYAYFQTSTPLAFLQTLLFFFWITLVSSLTLFIFLVLFYNRIATFDWGLTDLILSFLISVSSIKQLFSITLIWFLLLTCILIKCGTAPFYFWKPTFFKGINLISLFFYVYVYYFAIFFYLSYVMFLYLNEFFLSNLNVFSAVLFVAIITLPSFLFESFYIKTFLALSSILNSIFIFFAMCSVSSIDLTPLFII